MAWIRAQRPRKHKDLTSWFQDSTKGGCQKSCFGVSLLLIAYQVPKTIYHILYLHTTLGYSYVYMVFWGPINLRCLRRRLGAASCINKTVHFSSISVYMGQGGSGRTPLWASIILVGLKKYCTVRILRAVAYSWARGGLGLRRRPLWASVGRPCCLWGVSRTMHGRFRMTPADGQKGFAQDQGPVGEPSVCMWYTLGS